jgi:hypothetical protein
MPGENHAFITRVDPISPPPMDVRSREWWRRRVPPPGPLRLFRKAIYRHSRLLDRTNILRSLVTAQGEPGCSRMKNR